MPAASSWGETQAGFRFPGLGTKRATHHALGECTDGEGDNQNSHLKGSRAAKMEH